MRGAEFRVEFASEEARQRLPAEAMPALLAQLDRQTAPLKSNAQRRIHRFELPGGAYFLKLHLVRGAAGRLKQLVTGGPAVRELRASRYADAAGIPAVLISARIEFGSRFRPGTSLTISREVSGVRSLKDAFADIAALPEAHRRRAGLRALSDGVAQLLATAHNQAFLHHDVHPENVLVRQAESGASSCLFVDLAGARCGREVSDSDAARNLAALDQWFSARVTRTDRLRFLKTYAQLRRRRYAPAAFRRLVELIASAARRHAARLYAQRDRRIGRRSAFFDRQAAGEGVVINSTLRFRGLPAMLGVAAPDETTPGAAGGSAEAFAESFIAPDRAAGLSWRVAGSPASRKYRSACRLMNRDLPSVMPLACREARRGLIVAECGWRWLRPPDAATLGEWLDAASGRDRSRLLETTGRLIANTLLRGMVIYDPGPTRVEVTGMLRDRVRVYWAGVDATTIGVPAGRHACAWMLAQCALRTERDAQFTRADRARVLRACCRRLGRTLLPGGWKEAWRGVAALVPPPGD